MIYHAIVRSKILALFDAINRGNAEPLLNGFASRFEHRFLGEDHALGGSRTSIARTREWYERLYRLLPDIHFELERIDISGTPWDTLAVIEWRETNSGTDGVRTSNRGVHVVNLSWGKVTRVFVNTDTAGLCKTLDRIFATGVTEAHAAPISG